MIILKELDDYIDEKLKELFSSKDKEQYVSTTPEILRLSHQINSSQLIRGCRMRKGFDYIPVNYKNHPELMKRLISLGLSKNSHSSRTTLFFESAIWKVAINSKRDLGYELKEILSSEILPNLSKREPNSSILSSLKSIQ